ncbi:FliM/FliN family flagellar motor switch protein [Oceaniglobus ichthyenteri]|uniref:FliM/FliN family flagellar motor switch protein n=1 Tax=Oceaniglobus ichthyenteri TaxID=2136177 RepID=UPI000D385E8B|nr:FliM/FliN family flagellar motor switch protein [Oceaniglobus ichthyenteri]
MSMGATQSALRRKLRAVRTPANVQAMTLARAWRLSIVHGFSEAAGLVLTMDGHETTAIAPSEMPDQMGAGDLGVLLESAHGFGVALLDVQLLAALIEAQTMGRVLLRPSLARDPTPTDGAMIADPLDRALTLFEGHASGLEGAETCFGMRFATPLSDGRSVMMALPDESHIMTEITLSFGGGDRRGRLRLILPAALPKVDPVDVPDHEWNARIESNLMGAEAQLSAVLTRLHLPIEQVTEWKVGDLLTIPARSLTQIALISCTGSILAQGRLGQSNGNKAVMLDNIPEAPPVGVLPAATPGVGALMTGKPAFGQKL